MADISSTETKWPDEQIAAEIKHQNEIYPDLARLPDVTQRARTNAAARSHSGIQILHVQEWYSGNLYRLDQTDEGMVSEQYLKDHPGTYRNSYVNIDDPAVSPYRSYFANHELRDAQLSKNTLYAKNDLWCASGLEGEVASPLIISLLDSKSVPKGRRFTDADSSMLKINPLKAERLHNGSDPEFHLEAITESAQEGRTRFILRGRTMSMIEPHELSDMEFVYVVGRVGQRAVCMEASLTNYTGHTSFISKREGFDGQGVPRVWKRTTIKPGSPAKQVDVVFKEVDLNPTFKDGEVFLTVFPTNYTVSDVTSGQAIVLQKSFPSDVTTQPLAHGFSGKRVYVLCVFGVVALGLGVALLCMRGKRA